MEKIAIRFRLKLAASGIATLVPALLFAGLLSLASGRLAADEAERERGVLYLTLRDHTGSNQPGSFYGEERSDPKAGWCGIDQTELSFLAQAAEAVPFRIPDEILRVSGVDEFSEEILWQKLRETAGDRMPAIYVHGFFIDFEKGCRRATVFQENAKLTGGLLWFSWPSDGNLLNYARDEVDLYWSVPDLASTILRMEEEFGQGQVNLIGHSLGARGLVLALYDLISVNPEVRVDNVVLLAPDMDFEIFRKLLPRIAKLARRITIYTAPSDKPLALSAQLHGYPRLGQSGNDVARLAGVEVIDVGALPTSSTSGHLYHLYDATVGHDLDQLLNGGLRAEARENLVHLGDNLWRLEAPE